MTPSPASVARRNLAAILGIAVIAILPMLALVLPQGAHSAGAPQAVKLIVLLPSAATALPQAAVLLDRADARPLGQGAWPNLWLVASRDPDAVAQLYAAGARLVLAGDGILAGCLGLSATTIHS
jgi:hypothetical protein